MGHQINFYLSPKDMAEIEQNLKKRGAVLIHSRSSTREPRVVRTLDVEEGGLPWLFYCLARPQDLPQIVAEHVPPKDIGTST